MDIFALPDVFLRQLMKSMEIQDRLRMRFTCRAFEKLVAETNAGCMDHGQIGQGTDESKFSIRIGPALLNDFPATEEGFEQCLHLRNRLFRGITLTSFSIAWSENASLDFICKFTDKFKIGSLTFFVSSQNLLRIARQMMANFPTSRHRVYMYFLPEPEAVIALPPMESLHIKDSVSNTTPWQITSDQFFALLDKHECLDLDNTTLQADDCEKAMMIIAGHSDTRIVQVQISTTTIIRWLSNKGIDQFAPVGGRFGKFEVLASPFRARNVGRSELKIRYEDIASRHRCTIKVPGTYWDWGDDLCRMNFSNE